MPHVDPRLIGHDLAYPVMLRFLPAGFAGLMVGGLVAANSSTILTHLNWGASYWCTTSIAVSSNSTATEAHYVLAGRVATVALFVISSAAVYALDTAKSAFDIILQVGAGTGLLYLARWFWWRVNAWCEVVAMISSLAVSVVLLILARQGFGMSSHLALVTTVIATTACWVATAYLAPQTDPEVLRAFYLKVRPGGPGWGRSAPRSASPPDAAVGDPLPSPWSAGRSGARWCGRPCSPSARRCMASGRWPPCSVRPRSPAAPRWRCCHGGCGPGEPSAAAPGGARR